MNCKLMFVPLLKLAFALQLFQIMHHLVFHFHFMVPLLELPYLLFHCELNLDFHLFQHFIVVALKQLESLEQPVALKLYQLMVLGLPMTPVIEQLEVPKQHLPMAPRQLVALKHPKVLKPYQPVVPKVYQLIVLGPYQLMALKLLEVPWLYLLGALEQHLPMVLKLIMILGPIGAALKLKLGVHEQLVALGQLKLMALERPMVPQLQSSFHLSQEQGQELSPLVQLIQDLE